MEEAAQSTIPEVAEAHAPADRADDDTPAPADRAEDDALRPEDEALRPEDEATTSRNGVLSALRRAAFATGRGFKVAYRVTTENHHFLNAVLNGFVGDKLAQTRAPLAIPMRLRHEGRDLTVDGLDLPARLQGAGRTVVVMVHGLMCNEEMFRETRWQSSSPSRPGYGLRLEQELGATVLYVRYNSGLHISENGQALAAILDEVVAAAGPALERLVLVGHSMGGLVIRSAGYYGARDGAGWVDRLSTVLLVAAPTQGSFLEQFFNLGAFVLHRVGNPYTTLSGEIIDLRSHGIRDLRFGLMADVDWRHHPRDGRLRVVRTPIPPLPGVGYHVVVGSLPADPGSFVARHLGDGLVGTRSALGQAWRQPADPLQEVAEVRVFPSTGHFDLLISPEVGEHVVDVVRRAMGA